MDKFCPAIWAEEKPPAGIENCRDCGLFEHGSRMVWGEGNPMAPIMVVLDNPGAREDKEGSPFVCGTRQTLQKAAAESGLSEDDLYVTYILKRRPRKAYDKENARRICMTTHLIAQLESKTPAFVFCLGNIAVQSFFENSDAEVKALRQQWHNVKRFQTAVSYHPLAVRRRPNLWTSFIDDWRILASAYRNAFTARIKRWPL